MILDVGPVGHGGICVAHTEEGQAVLVRHALPGERVRVAVTERRASYLRADAVEVLRASAHRVRPPCPWAGPGRCGGCDFQHVELAEQRRLKEAVVSQALSRIAGIEREVTVEPVPGEHDGLHWRTRMRLAVDPQTGRAGLRRHRSHVVEPVDDCLLAAPDVPVRSVVTEDWGEASEVELTAAVVEQAAGRTWQVPEGAFWQVHPGAADLLASTVVDLARPAPGEDCLDLYAGVGLFAGTMASPVSPGTTTAVESSSLSAAAARANLADLPTVDVVEASVDRWLRRQRPEAAVVVLDPPRRGAGTDVVAGVAATAATRVVYVACDPTALARDLVSFAAHSYRVSALRAFDLFPMTAHVECVALLERT